MCRYSPASSSRVQAEPRSWSSAHCTSSSTSTSPRSGAISAVQQMIGACSLTVDLDRLAAARLAGHGARGARGRGLGGDARDRPQEVDQLGHIIRPDIVDRAAAALEEELGIGVPVLHAVRQHRRGARDRAADPPGIERAATGLVRRAEEGVGRAADAHAPAGGGEHQRLPLAEARGERLLRIDVLAGGDDLPADRAMGERHGEVDDDLDLVVGEQRVHRDGRDAVLLGFGRGGLGHSDRRSASTRISCERAAPLR